MHAEAIFVGGAKPADTAAYVKEVRAAAVANGRDPNHVKIFPQMTPILGRTLEEAQAKHARYKAAADWRGGMAKLSQYLNVDLFSYPLDEPFDTNSVGKSDSSIHTVINSLQKSFGGQPITPRMLGEKMAFCGFGPQPVGTPEMVADMMEDWRDNADIDGFNIACEYPCLTRQCQEETD
jgi:alkanesulfonate monooxygenase SsuD/methylene tetrahydromethanopterin reductase-like flavin-dependent oxidoreductase (luciferase family)